MLRLLMMFLFLAASGCAPLAQTDSGSFLVLDIRQAISSADPQLQKPDSNISVAQKNGIVLLLGDTGSEELKQLAQQAAATVEGVRMVHNEIRVNAGSAGIAVVSDSLITSRVKAQLLNTEGLPPNRVKVVTERGIVYLIGTLSHQQAGLAAEAARRIGGVQKVVRVFEYAD